MLVIRSNASAESCCQPASVATDTTTTTITCAATSVGGTSTQAGTVKHDASPPTTPTVSGIEARDYTRSKLAAADAVTCAASDPTSGLTGCVVTGHSAALGTHTLTATATNGAGLTSTAALTCTVVPEPPAPPAATPPPSPPFVPVRAAAISALTAPKGRVSASSIVRSGLRAALTAAGAKTKLKILVTMGGRVPASQTSTVKPGKMRLTIRLGRRAAARLRAKPGTLTLKVTGSASGFRTVTLQANVRTRR